MPPDQHEPIEVKVKPRVAFGASSVATGSVSLVAFVLAIYAYANGERDEATIGALATGVAALLAFVAGRVSQAVAGILATRSSPPAPVPLEPVLGRLAGDSEVDDLAERVDGVEQRIRRVARVAEEALGRARGDGPFTRLAGEAPGADAFDAAEPGLPPTVYGTGDEALLETGDPGDDRDLVPGMRETEGEPELDDVDELTPDLDRLGVGHVHDVRTVTAHEAMRDA